MHNIIPFVPVDKFLARYVINSNTQEFVNDDIIVEWVGQAIRYFGKSVAYEQSAIPIEITIENYRGLIDCDVKTIVAVQDQQGFVMDRTDAVALGLPKDQLRIDRAWRDGYTHTRSRNTYSVADYPYIDVNFQSGIIYMWVIKLPIKDGVLYYPDSEEFERYLEWFIEERISKIMWRSGKTSFNEYKAVSSEMSKALRIASNVLTYPSYENFREIMAANFNLRINKSSRPTDRGYKPTPTNSFF